MKESETIVEKMQFEIKVFSMEDTDGEEVKDPNSSSIEENLHWLLIII